MASPGNNNVGSTRPLEVLQATGLRNSDSMSSYGSPITFTARPASSDTLGERQNSSCFESKNLTHNRHSISSMDNSEGTHASTQSLKWETSHRKTSNSTSESDNVKLDISNTLHNDTLELVVSPAADTAAQLNPVTSTPKAPNSTPQRPDTLNNVTLEPYGSEDNELTSSMSSNVSVQSTESQTDSHNEGISVPILGYEVMEERARFTVYKIAVHQGNKDQWFIFRRYNDFVHLNDQLKELFPHFRLALPPKKWFGDNFDKDFIDDRMLGLQAFLNNIVGHRNVCNSEPVQEFFCFNDPPGPHDSLEESKVMCEMLEEELYNMRRDLRERDAQISLLREELALKNTEIDNLRKSLRIERALNSSRMRERASPSSQSQKSENSLPEALMEADSNQAPSSTVVSPASSIVARDVTEDVTKDIKNMLVAAELAPSAVNSINSKHPSGDSKNLRSTTSTSKQSPAKGKSPAKSSSTKKSVQLAS